MSDRQRLTAKDVLTSPTTFPNSDAAIRLSRLVGLDHYIEALCQNIRLFFDPQLGRDWSNEHYGKVLPIVDLLDEAVPLIVFEGDVGTGKTALADTIANRVATEGDYGVHLVKMSTRVRGTGYVGEMGTLLAESFEHVSKLWERTGEPVLFVIDEADSLLTSRESDQHHHEDKSGVNTILQHLDALRASPAQIVAIAITNRVGVLDPAVRRRATLVLTFYRPDTAQRTALLSQLLEGSGVTESGLKRLVSVSGKRPATDGGPAIRLSYSDLTLRFAVPAIRDAIHAGVPLEVESLIKKLEGLHPSPEIGSPTSGTDATD